MVSHENTEMCKFEFDFLVFWPQCEYPTNSLTIKGGASSCLFRCQKGNLGIIDLNFESVKIHTIRFFGTFFVPFFWILSANSQVFHIL